MEKKITLYIVALASVVAAVEAENVTEKDGIHVRGLSFCGSTSGRRRRFSYR